MGRPPKNGRGAAAWLGMFPDSLFLFLRWIPGYREFSRSRDLGGPYQPLGCGNLNGVN